MTTSARTFTAASSSCTIARPSLRSAAALGSARALTPVARRAHEPCPQLAQPIEPIAQRDEDRIFPIVLIHAEHRAARPGQRPESRPPSAPASGSAAVCGPSARCRRRSDRSAGPPREISAAHAIEERHFLGAGPSVAARSICRFASRRIEWPNKLLDVLLDVGHVAARFAPPRRFPSRAGRGSSATVSGPIARSKMSDAEWAGSVETSRTRRPIRLAASAVAAAQVVLPTPPLPPKKSTCRSSSCFMRHGSTEARRRPRTENKL